MISNNKKTQLRPTTVFGVCQQESNKPIKGFVSKKVTNQ